MHLIIMAMNKPKRYFKGAIVLMVCYKLYVNSDRSNINPAGAKCQQLTTTPH